MSTNPKLKPIKELLIMAEVNSISGADLLPYQSGYQLQVHAGAASYLLAHTTGGYIRVFNTLDGAVSTLRDLKIKNVRVTL